MKQHSQTNSRDVAALSSAAPRKESDYARNKLDAPSSGRALINLLQCVRAQLIKGPRNMGLSVSRTKKFRPLDTHLSHDNFNIDAGRQVRQVIRTL